MDRLSLHLLAQAADGAADGHGRRRAGGGWGGSGKRGAAVSCVAEQMTSVGGGAWWGARRRAAAAAAATSSRRLRPRPVLRLLRAFAMRTQSGPLTSSHKHRQPPSSCTHGSPRCRQPRASPQTVWCRRGWQARSRKNGGQQPLLWAHAAPACPAAWPFVSCSSTPPPSLLHARPSCWI